MDSSVSGYGPLSGFCKQGNELHEFFIKSNELPGCIQNWEFCE